MDDPPNLLEDNNKRKFLMSDELNYYLSHQINIYLIGILADVENIHNEIPLDSDLKKMSMHLLGQIKRLHMMTESILVLSSQKNYVPHFYLHNIYKPVFDAISLYREEASVKGLVIKGPTPIGEQEFPIIEMSLFDLTLAFNNLIHNAIKYSFIPSTKNDVNRYIRVIGGWFDDEQKFYSISIQNYGVGIAREEIEKRLIFEPYYRGQLSMDRNRTGSGIGLAYANKVIEQMHHGKLEVESIHVSGQAYLTTFKVILPLNHPIS